MKKVITGEELNVCKLKAIELLCGTVKNTLGPRGCNAIIDHSMFSPFITNDGVTIAKNIESEDERINTILTLAKEASIKTDETVGDGTTTTLVLLESIFKNGLKKIKEGINPNVLKKELEEATIEIIEKIKTESKEPTKDNYFHIASIAANDTSIGKLISSVYLKLNNPDAIKILESSNTETYFKIIHGYTFETVLASPYFLNNKQEINYKDSYLLIINKEINDIAEISEVINYLIDKKRPAVFLATDYTDEVINEVLSLNFNNITNVTLLKTPEYGLHAISLLNDLETISQSKIVKITDEININNLGKCQNIKIDKNEVVISSDPKNNKVSKLIEKIKGELTSEQDTYEQDFLKNRLAKLTNGVGIIYVGASTTTEAREKKMRFDDAMWALKSTRDGVLPGSGVILLKIKENLTAKNNGYEILKESLDKPFRQILDNVGIDNLSIYKKIKESNYNLVYNVLEEKFENVTSTCVIDPTSVVINALKNASSIAGMLLTTTSLIINEYQEPKEYNGNNEL